MMHPASLVVLLQAHNSTSEGPWPVAFYTVEHLCGCMLFEKVSSGPSCGL